MVGAIVVGLFGLVTSLFEQQSVTSTEPLAMRTIAEYHAARGEFSVLVEQASHTPGPSRSFEMIRVYLGSRTGWGP
jgi:hypothetical protein